MVDSAVGVSARNTLARLDGAPLRWRYWALYLLLLVAGVAEFFDLFAVGFIVAAVGSAWQLTFAESALMLLSGGVGAIAGAMLFGPLADRIGRRPTLLATLAICGLSSLLLSLSPEGDWRLFCACRFLIGVGAGGAGAIQASYIVEFTPTRLRSVLPGLLVALASLGILIASSTAATLMHSVGWRSMAVIGGAPLVVAALGVFIFPESVRWLAAKGRDAQAADIAEKFAPQGAVAVPAASPAPAAAADAPVAVGSRSRLALVFLAWFGASTAFNGIYLWGPTVLAMSQRVEPAKAAGMFVLVSLTGLTGKLIFAVLPQMVGRRRTAVLMGLGGAIFLACAAFSGAGHLGTLPMLLAAMMASVFFIEGGYANLTPYTAEMFSVQGGARSMGVAQAANGLGKIVGPLIIATIAGLGDRLTPKATAEAVTPGFLLLAGFAAAIAVSFLIIRMETHGRPMALK